MNQKKIAGIILAAGVSSRMGQIKQLLPYKKGTLLGYVIEQAKHSRLDEIILVLGFQSKTIIEQIDLSGLSVIQNQNYKQGQASSLITGLGRVSKNISAAMFLLADQPGISSKIINRLVQAWYQSTSDILIPYYNNKRGNPVIINSCLFSELKKIKGDTGARVLFDRHSDQILKVGMDEPGVLFDVDTPQDYKCLLDSVST